MGSREKRNNEMRHAPDETGRGMARSYKRVVRHQGGRAGWARRVARASRRAERRAAREALRLLAR